ncbi:MAG: hypothetical protein ACK40K_00055 [Raineya sp.]
MSAFIFLASCQNSFERKGVVLDKQTQKPIEGVSVEIYMKTQRRDSLKEKVLTDKQGYFWVKENIKADKLFVLEKEGYIGFVSSLEKPNDTIFLEKLDK